MKQGEWEKWISLLLAVSKGLAWGQVSKNRTGRRMTLTRKSRRAAVVQILLLCQDNAGPNSVP
jgi:hypothetical protein